MFCGPPFYVSGEIADWRPLANRGLDDLTGAGLEIHSIQSMPGDEGKIGCAYIRARKPLI